MPTVYPGAFDSFVNPVDTDTLNSPPHDEQHADSNDAIEAIEAELGLDPSGSSATVRARLDALVQEGTWTPVLEATTTDPSVTYAQQIGLYVKIGRLVNLWWLFQLDVVTTQGVGSYRVAGIPFEFSADFPAWAPLGSADYFDSSVNNIQVARRHSTNAGRMSLLYDATGSGSSGHMSNSTETLATNDTFQGQATYLTDD